MAIEKWLGVVLVVVLVALVALLFSAFVMFTALVKWEYAHYSEAWRRDGRPVGFFWIPASGSGLAANFVSFKWLFVTPSWAREDERAKHLLRWYRICVATWNGGVVALLVAGALLMKTGLLP